MLTVTRRALRPPARRASSSSSTGPGRHAEWYSQVLPSMFPIAVLGSSVYIALHLVQTHLSRERHIDQANAQIEALESELEKLRQQPVPQAIADIPPTPPPRRWWPF